MTEAERIAALEARCSVLEQARRDDSRIYMIALEAIAKMATRAFTELAKEPRPANDTGRDK